MQLAEGAFVHVPIIDGANTDEATLFAPMGINTTQDWINDIINPVGANPITEYYVPEILKAYPGTCDYLIPPSEEIPCDVDLPSEFGDTYRRVAAYFGDLAMVANRRGTCRAWVSESCSPVQNSATVHC